MFAHEFSVPGLNSRMKVIVAIVSLFILIGGLVATSIVSSPSPSSESDNDFASVLLSQGASAELGDAASVYDWLIGNWDVRVVDHLSDGVKRESAGEWHFSWVLEGRAVQDIWISPPRSQRSSSLSKTGNRYGTSLRVYDSKIDAWKVIWLNPVSGAHDELIGRRKGSDIMQEGCDSDGNQMRWVFTDIKTTSFRWYGERSYDGGKSWKLEAEFFAKRKQKK